MAEISPDKISPEARMAAERLRIATEAHMTPEQRYERAIGKLPKAAKMVAPGTMGEAGFGLGSLAAAGAGLALAPESMGTSLAMAAPLVGAIAGGALEDPAHRIKGALWEGGKGLAAELGGRLVAKGGELATRALSKNAMLDKSASRIAESIPRLFHRYPLAAPTTAGQLEEDIGGGKVAQAAGDRLGKFRNALEKQFGKYKPAVPAKLVSPSSGVAAHYTTAVPASGQSVMMPDLDAEGNKIMRRMGIGDAIDHVNELLAGGRTAGGSVKSTASAPRVMDVAVQARDALASQLNSLQKGLGDEFLGLRRDVGVGKQLQKVFASSRRTTSIAGGSRGVIDQPKVLDRAEKAAAKLNQIRPGAGTRLSKAVAPTGGKAVQEMGPGIRAHAGESGIRTMLHPPVPFKPEDRSMLPLLGRIFSDPRLARLYGYLGERGVENAVEPQ